MRVGERHYERVANHAACLHPDCSKRVMRRGQSMVSPYCLAHHREATERLTALGLSWSHVSHRLHQAAPRGHILVSGEC